MPNVTLSGGPSHGAVINVGDPWPRDYLKVLGETYIVNAGGPPYTASWVDPGTVEVPEEEIEGSGGQGPPGLDGAAGPPGPPGPAGPGVTHRGAWSAATTYSLNDAVTYAGSSYLSKVDLNLNHQPDLPASSVQWGLMASPGATGPAGPTGPAGATGPEGPQGDPGSPLPAREEVAFTTASLAANASENGTVTVALGFRILRLDTSRAAWVRFYTTPTKRTLDAARDIGADPTGDHGVTLEGITSAALLGFDTSPVPQSYSMEDPPTEDISYRVTNLGAAGPVTVTLVIQKQEV